MQGREFGIEFLTAGYRFVEYDAQTGQWADIIGDETLRLRSLPTDNELELYLEGKRILLDDDPAPFEDPEENTSNASRVVYSPHLMVFSSGDATPYELHLVRRHDDQRIIVRGNALGDLEICRSGRGIAMRHLKRRGFTLLEVMVALIIVSFALTAVTASMNQMIDAAESMRNRTYASWIAQNRITELRLAFATPDVGTSSGDVQYANTDWSWRASVSETGVDDLYRIDVFRIVCGQRRCDSYSDRICWSARCPGRCEFCLARRFARRP